MGYGVSLVDSNSGIYFASVNAVVYAMSWYTGLRYNGTQLQLNIKSAHNVTSMNMDTYNNHINLLETNQMTITKQLKTGPGPRLNIKTVLSTYGDFHVKDKTVVRTSYL